MLGIIYILIATLLGDAICRQFYSFASIAHRIAAAFLTGILISTWLTYLGGQLFSNTSNPLFWSNIVFFVTSGWFILRFRRRIPAADLVPTEESGHPSLAKWDWIAIGCAIVLASWLMLGTLNMDDGKLQVGNHQWSDFGPNVAIMQSFAVGDNFPTEYPHFSGDRIRYHFMFYFAAGNLVYLGLNPALSNNLLSVFSLVSMLILVMTLGTLLFNSRAIGWIAAGLFFFHGTLSFIPFIQKHDSIGAALEYALTMRDFLPSGFPYRGEDWGVWSQVVFVNQRHFASSIGILLLVLIFVVITYQKKLGPLGDDEVSNLIAESDERNKVDGEFLAPGRALELLRSFGPFLFSGILLGLMPLWNSAVFTAAFAVLATIFLLSPFKRQMFVLALATGIIALPQVIYLKTGNIPPAGYSLFHWGYTVDDPTFLNVIYYLLFTFGLKGILVGVSLYNGTKLQRIIFLAVSSLLAVAFLFQFSVEVLANHKFLNIWLVVANVYAAHGLLCLWNPEWFRLKILPRSIAIVLVASVVISGTLDLFPIKNEYWVEVPVNNDELITWLKENTAPDSVFLTDRVVTHPILLAGRRVFHGFTYYTWGAGYPAGERDVVYKRMFEERDPRTVLQLLRENNISYVAIDNAVRKGGFVKNLNESVYKANFEAVFNDTQNKYNGLDIYKVGTEVKGVLPEAITTESLPPLNAFEGGEGKLRGQFDKPRGISVDEKGSFYVADGGNSRIQKFSADGIFVSSFGKPGSGEGELSGPAGVAVDASGNIWVTDAANNRLSKFKPDGTIEKQWTGPDTGFVTPRDLVIGPNKKIYILDQSKGRVVWFDTEKEQFGHWGRTGTGPGEFTEMTGLSIGGDRIFVADAKTDRVQVFDLEGGFVGQWNVPQWENYIWHRPDLAVDTDAKLIYVTSGWTKEVLIFDLEGTFIRSIKPERLEALTNPSAIALTKSDSVNRLLVLDTGSDAIQTGGARVSLIDLEIREKK